MKILKKFKLPAPPLQEKIIILNILLFVTKITSKNKIFNIFDSSNMGQMSVKKSKVKFSLQTTRI